MSLRRLRRFLARTPVKPLAFHGLCLLLRIGGGLRRRRIIVYHVHPAFARKCDALADVLRTRGFRAEVRSGKSFATRARLEASRDLWIGFWNFLPRELLPTYYVFWNAEPLDRHRERTRVDDEWFATMGNAQEIWGYQERNAEETKHLGVPFRFVPFGYAPWYETSFRSNIDGTQVEQDIDVLFFGRLSERRRHILDVLEQGGVRVGVLSEEKTAYGQDLDELLARSKIVLGIHFYDEPRTQIADFGRLDHPISNRRFVVHERPSAGSDPAFEQHVTTCEFDRIPETCAHFLTRPEERARRAAAAYEWFKADYALDAFIPYESLRALLRRPVRRRVADARASAQRPIAPPAIAVPARRGAPSRRHG